MVSFYTHVLVWVTIAIIKHHDQSNLVREKVVWFILTIEGIGIQTGQESVGRRGCRDHGGVLFTGLLLIAFSAFLLIGLRTTCSGTASPTVDWVLCTQ